MDHEKFRNILAKTVSRMARFVYCFTFTNLGVAKVCALRVFLVLLLLLLIPLLLLLLLLLMLSALSYHYYY